MELEALGELKPGAPIRLGWKVGARTDSHGVQVSLTLPEVEAARESDWGEGYRVQLDRKPERAQTWHGDLAEGEVKSGVLVFSVPAPGYYRVSFVAKAQDEMSPEGAETVYSTSGVRRVWLFVDDASGMVTSEFEPDRIPEGFKRAPGPRRSLSSKKKSRASFLPSNLLRRSAGLVKGFFGFHQGGTIPLEVIYYNDIDNDWYTVPEIYWEVNHKEWVGRVLTTTSTESGFTSNSGRLYPGCDGEEYQVGWRFEAHRFAFWMAAPLGSMESRTMIATRSILFRSMRCTTMRSMS